jgi:hypothetical protein
MKRIVCVLAFVLVFTLHPSAGELRLGASMGYYSITDSIYKSTYGSGEFICGGSLSYDLLRLFEIRGEVAYFKDKGEMTLTQEEIEFSMIPVVLGIRAKLIKMERLSPYLGAGVDLCSYKEKARLGNTSESTVGFHIEGGSYIALGHRFRVDLNLRYVKADAQPFDETIRLGGWRAGVGVDYSF